MAITVESHEITIFNSPIDILLVRGLRLRFGSWGHRGDCFSWRTQKRKRNQFHTPDGQNQHGAIRVQKANFSSNQSGFSTRKRQNTQTAQRMTSAVEVTGPHSQDHQTWWEGAALSLVNICCSPSGGFQLTLHGLGLSVCPFCIILLFFGSFVLVLEDHGIALLYSQLQGQVCHDNTRVASG